MVHHLQLKKIFLCLCYILLFFYTKENNLDPIFVNKNLSTTYILGSGILKSDIFLDPKLNQGWQPVVYKVCTSHRIFLSFSTEKKFIEPLKNYAQDNVDLDFNFPFICYKFPRSEDTKEG